MGAGIGGQGIVGDLVARGEYGKAVALLKAQLSNRPYAVALRVQLGEVLALAGRRHEAAALLGALSSDLARHGLAAQSIAVMKRVQLLDPSVTGETGLADLLHRATHGEPVPPPVAAPGLDAAASVDGVVPVRREVLEFLGEDPAPAAEERDAVSGAPLFAGFSRDELAAVIQALRLLAFEPGDLVVTEGEPGRSLFLVSLGTVKAFARSGDGPSRLVAQLGEGDVFGEASLLRGTPRAATVTASSPCELLELDRPTVDRIAEGHPNVRRVLEEFCARRLAEARAAV